MLPLFRLKNYSCKISGSYLFEICEKERETFSWISSAQVCLRWPQLEKTASIDPGSFIFQTQSSFRDSFDF